MAGKKRRSKKKISSAFSARLARLAPEDKVHAFVLLRAGGAGSRSGKRQTRAEREAAVKAARTSAERALPDIDKILKKHDGRRLARRPNALGSLPVETTAAGIRALARSRWVQAVLEDQPIHLYR
jgi:hypothetical protein